MSETLDLNQESAGKRPGFLTVLCILTFIGSGWGAISAVAFQDAGLTAYAAYYPWVMLVLNLGTLFGALQMWKMKKSGLMIWTACEVIGVVLMWVVVKGYISSLMSPAMDNAMEGMSSELSGAFANAGNAMIESAMNMALIIGSIFPAVFIILYWVNAKHLK
ncbi:MAG: hypothetical protein V4622_10380 [Bacteroidota bacterium]